MNEPEAPQYDTLEDPGAARLATIPNQLVVRMFTSKVHCKALLRFTVQVQFDDGSVLEPAQRASLHLQVFPSIALMNMLIKCFRFSDPTWHSLLH